jgi:hypothetical protein
MTSVLGRSVSTLRLHTTTHAKGIGNLGPNIDKDTGGVKGRVKMIVVSEGVLLMAGSIQVVFPSGNIVSYELEPVKDAPVNEANNSSSGGNF